MTLALDKITLVSAGEVAPNISFLTTKAVDGTGVFDVLMQTVNLHLTKEYETGRITGKEYSAVYLGAVSAVLQQSVAYLDSSNRIAQINAEIALIRQKTVTELASTDNTIPEGLGFNGDANVEGLVANQILLTSKQIDLADSQVTKTEKEITFTIQQTMTELAKTDNDIPTGIGALNNGITVEGIMLSERQKADAETKLLTQKLVTEIAQVNTTLPDNIGENGNTTVLGLIKSQLDKTTAEEMLLKQKTITELAQTSNDLPDTYALNTNTTIIKLTPADDDIGVIGSQRALFTAQTNGFARDAEQKLTKMMLDTWSVRKTVDEGTTVDNVGITDLEINNVLNKAKLGIGAAEYTPPPPGP